MRTAAPAAEPSRKAWLWPLLIVLLLAIRVPSLVQPAGGDQGLYGYSGQRMLAGDVMYRDMWDQKPPAIAALYAVFWKIWPSEHLVPAADLGAAIGVACLLVVLGRRRYSVDIGYGAASLFLLLGDPYLMRLSGIYVRGQCEPFMALAVASGLVLLAHPARRRWHLAGAGVALAAAFWLKYNSAAYALPLAVAAWAWRPASSADPRQSFRDLGWIALGFGAVAVVVLACFAATGALLDLRLATLDYNLRYSNETYTSPAGIFGYIIGLPIERARMDILWFLGGLGAALLIPSARSNGSTLVAFSWVLAAAISIAVNGSRGLPNYFVQATPALALAASAGLARLPAYGRAVRVATAVLILAAVWRVGSDTPVWGMRLASMPGLVDNVRYDLDFIRGRMDRDTYFSRFKGQKHDALEIDRLVRFVRGATDQDDAIFVFGFSGGSVSWKSERVSSSRFFWSRPITIGFEEDREGYGSAGLLADLVRRPPVIVALQKEEWRSRDFFMNNDALRRWLESGYVLDHETPMFSVWRKTS